MQRADARKVRVLYDGKPRWNLIWDNNPRLARPEEEGDFQILHARVSGRRQYIAAYDSQRFTWQAYTPHRGEIYLSDEERKFAEQYASRLIIEPHIKPGASQNKNWGWARWLKLAKQLRDNGIRYTQLGPPGAKPLEGAEFVMPSIRQADAIVAKARGVITHEGALHHIAAAFNVPSIVLRGGFISPAVTGYDGQFDFFVGDDLGCGMRVRCEHCDAAMASIKPTDVLMALDEIRETA